MGERAVDMANEGDPLGSSEQIAAMPTSSTAALPNGSVGRRARLPLLSPGDLATYLAVPLATVYRWRSRREGPRGIKVGRHVRYRIDEVERWLDERREHRP